MLLNSTDLRQRQTGAPTYSRAWLNFLANYVFVPNVPFLVARQFLYLDRPILNIDYIVLGILAPFLSRSLNLTLFTACLVCDMLFSATGVYHLPVADALRAVRALPNLSIGAIVLVVVIAGAVCFMWIRAAIHSRAVFKEAYPRWSIGVTILLACGVINAAGGVMSGKAKQRRFTFDPARSSFWTAGRAIAVDFRPLAVDPNQFWRTPSSSVRLLENLPHHGGTENENIVVVIVESLGFPNDQRLWSAIVAPLLNEAIQRQYTIRTGVVPFNGSTVAAEFRELCGIEMGLRGESLSHQQLSPCLPNRFAQSGYKTISIHGFTATMFGRERWYKEIGFQQSLFLESWPTRKWKQCGSQFRGVCDEDAAQMLKRNLEPSSSKKLVYWLTLDSHIQIQEELIERPANDSLAGVSPDVRGFVIRLQRVLAAIAAVATDTHIARTHFIVVGDHAPPFILLRKRHLFSQQVVPYVELTPRVKPERFPERVRPVSLTGE